MGKLDEMGDNAKEEIEKMRKKEELKKELDKAKEEGKEEMKSM